MDRDTGIKLMQDLLRRMVERKGSDLFITAGFPPAIKVDGEINTDDFSPAGDAATRAAGRAATGAAGRATPGAAGVTSAGAAIEDRGRIVATAPDEREADHRGGEGEEVGRQVTVSRRRPARCRIRTTGLGLREH